MVTIEEEEEDRNIVDTLLVAILTRSLAFAIMDCKKLVVSKDINTVINFGEEEDGSR